MGPFLVEENPSCMMMEAWKLKFHINTIGTVLQDTIANKSCPKGMTT
jgi:hypothetical protein